MEKDEYIGETFKSKDWRHTNYRIKIVEATSVGRYLYEIVTHEDNPARVGRHGRIRPATLDKRYVKVSH